MLLPPAGFSCDSDFQIPYQLAPMLSPPPPSAAPACASPNSSILSTCRNLQSLLQSSLPSTAASIIRPPPHLGSPISFNPKLVPSTKKKRTDHKVTKPIPKTPVRKRRRALSEDAGPSYDQENTAQGSGPSTPKRQRKCPPSLPMGLDREDFDALPASPVTPRPHTPFQLQPDMRFVTPSRPLPFNIPQVAPHRTRRSIRDDGKGLETSDADMDWTTSDDTALVQLILNKLRLRQSDWEDVSHQLSVSGNKDSFGERWKMLVGEGTGSEYGELRRRSKGIQRRRALQSMEFGPEIGEP